MGIFNSLKSVIKSRLQGEDNFTMYGYNIAFIIKYCLEKHAHRFNTPESVLVFAGVINLQYYIFNKLLDIQTIQRWATGVIQMNRCKDKIVNDKIITDFVAEIQVFCFSEEFKKNNFLQRQVQKQVESNYSKTMKAVFEVMDYPLVIKSELQKNYIKEIETLLENSQFKNLRSQIDIIDF